MLFDRFLKNNNSFLVFYAFWKKNKRNQKGKRTYTKRDG